MPFQVACQPIETMDVASLSLSASPTEIVLEESNSYQQEVLFNWSLSNLSEDIISSETHELYIGSAVPGSLEETVIATPSFEAAPGESISGEYTHLISGISVEGNFEYTLILLEKSGEYMQEVARSSSLPYSLNWGE